MKRAWPFVLLLGLIVAVLWRPRPAATPLPPPKPPPTEARAPDPGQKLDFTAGTPEPRRADPVPDPLPELEPEFKPSPDLQCLIWLVQNQNEDGSWGDLPMSFEGHVIDKPGVTALALLALMGAGYSHLSKDAYEGKSMGEAVKKGFAWLFGDRREDGSFRSARDAALEQGLAGLAVSEAYGLTGSVLYKEPAERTINGLIRLQRRDCWGSPVQNTWATLALWSASLSDVPFPRESLTALRRHYDAAGREETGALMFLMGIDQKRRDNPALAAAAERIAARRPDPNQADLYGWYFETMILFHQDGPNGARWKPWGSALRTALTGSQSPGGPWQGGTKSHTLVRTSLGALTFQIVTRYRGNVFSTEEK